MFSEKDMEDAIIRDPEKYLGEKGLRLIARQYTIGNYRFDLLFEDRHGANLIVEIQKGTLDRLHTYKIFDYFDEFKSKNAEKFVELMVVANKIPRERRDRLKSYGVTYKEIPDSEFLNLTTDSEKKTLEDQVPLSKPQEESQSAKPNDQITSGNNKKGKSGQSSSKGEAYRSFFKSLIDDLRENHNFTQATNAMPRNYHCFNSGITGLWYCAEFSKENRAKVELYIDQGDKESNKRIFENLFRNKEAIQAKLNHSLVWERCDEIRASRISVYRQGSIDSSNDFLHELHNWMKQNLLEFKKTFDPYLRSANKL